ncbi:MAG: cytochrome c oxidase subunit II [Puniceicoccaceae bacterium]
MPRLLLILLPVLSSLLMVGCQFDSRQSTFDPKGIIAREQLQLFYLTLQVTSVIFLAVGGVLLWVVWKYRIRRGKFPADHPKQDHGNPLVEISLIGVSILLLAIIAVPTVRVIWYTHELPEDPESLLGHWYTGQLTSEAAAEEPLIIYAYGWQWWFSFEYPQLGIVTANEFAFPKDRNVVIELRAKDVIHSFWLPKIAGKVDMIPGRTNRMWVRADEEGYYYGQCAEFCGESHAYMQFRADVFDDAGFAEWVERQRSPAPSPNQEVPWDTWFAENMARPVEQISGTVEKGAHLFMGRGVCLQCHAIGGTPARGNKGPDLTHVASRASIAAGWLEHRTDEGGIDRKLQYENLYHWILNSEKIKPGNLMHNGNGGLHEVGLTIEEVHHLTAFLMTLK